MKRLAANRIVSVTLVAIGLALFSQAQAVAIHDRSLRLAQGTAPPPQICPEVYQPVCGTSPGGMRTTYSNACFARAAMATDVTPGECGK
jgi:hypothetical protein